MHLKPFKSRIINLSNIKVLTIRDTFWGAKYAKVKDPFGVIWDLNYQKA